MLQPFSIYTQESVTKSDRVLNTPSDFAKTNLLYLQEAGYLKSLKSHISKREKLDSYLFLIVLSGRGKFTYQKQEYLLSPKDCLLINCANSYSHQSSEEEPWELMWIHFSGRDAIPFLTYYNTLVPSVLFHVESFTDFTSIIEQCMQLSSKKDIASEFLIHKSITDLLTLCISHNQKESEDKASIKMREIKEYIDIHFAEDISLSQLAEAFFISKYYLAREFKDTYGVTVGSHITSCRITYAKTLLRFTDLKIEEIAGKCGIPDTNYFTKVFRKLEGCTPKVYRKQW